MRKDANSIELLKNSAKTIGGVIGVEHALHEKMHARGDV
jgi:hypothetical protein